MEPEREFEQREERKKRDGEHDVRNDHGREQQRIERPPKLVGARLRAPGRVPSTVAIAVETTATTREFIAALMMSGL